MNEGIRDRITGAALADLLEMARGFRNAEEVPGNTLAELWAYASRDIGSGLHGTACEKVGEAGDVYQLIDAWQSGDIVRPMECYAVAVVTWGWAAPIDTLGDDAPSQSPERRRVRLIFTIDDTRQMFSRIHFADTGENTDDEGEARGPLAEALAASFI